MARSRIRVARLSPILDFIESLGIDWYFEWPVGASGWGEIRELATRRSSGAYHEAVVRGCAVGLRDPSGNLLAKAWRILTTNAEFAQHMNLPCSRDHDHGIVQGKVTATTSYYPRAMCRRIAKLWLRKADWVKDVRELNLVGSMEVDVPSYLIGAVQIGKEKEEPTDQGDLDKMDKLLLKIHCNSGHTNNSNLQRLLMQKKAPKWIVERAGLLKCSDCHEQQTEPSKNVIALNPRAQLWQALGADPFEVEVPSRGEVTKAVIWVDVASRLCVCSELFTRKLDDHRNVKWEELRSAFLRDWAQHHGRPQWLMTDPEGSWMTRDFATWLGSCGIGCGVTAGEAHYQLGLVERAIGVIKAMVKKIATKHSDLTGIEMIHLACTMHNDLERIRGFSPLQWAKGKHPDGMDGDADGFDNLPLRMQEADPNSEFHRNLQIRLDAADAFHRAKAEVAISKARNAATRRPRFWRTGDWVFYWRRKERTKGRRGATFLGSWLGPARVIFVEPEFNPKKLGNGEVTPPGSIIWVVHQGRLLRCSPQQLRDASSRERYTAQLLNPENLPLSLKDALLKGEFDDLFANIPGEEEVAVDLPERPDQGLRRPRPDDDHESKASSRASSPAAVPAQAAPTQLELAMRNPGMLDAGRGRPSRPDPSLEPFEQKRERFNKPSHKKARPAPEVPLEGPPEVPAGERVDGDNMVKERTSARALEREPVAGRDRSRSPRNEATPAAEGVDDETLDDFENMDVPTIDWLERCRNNATAWDNNESEVYQVSIDINHEKAFLRNPEVYVAQALKKGRGEVSFGKLSAAEKW